MKVIYFTKFLQGLSAGEIGELAVRFGFDGLDLAVRAGQSVNPDNVAEALPQAMEVWCEQGVAVPLVSLEGNAVDPDDPRVQRVILACGQAGIPLVKLGYWTWRAGQDYPAEADRIRRSLAKFGDLAERAGVCCLVHTHSGTYYGCNASAAMALLQDLDPARVGLYLDPAHLAMDGEPLPMALAIGRSHLRMVAVKNASYQKQPDGARSRWRQEWGLLREGLVDWIEAVRLLRQIGYDGALSLHGEYSATEEREGILPRVAEDLAHLRAAVQDATAAPQAAS